MPKRILFSSIVLIVSMFTTQSAMAAIAGQPDAASVQAVQSCVDAAKAANASADACIGILATPCLNLAQTIPSKEACNTKEMSVWSLLMQRDDSRLLAITGASAAPALRDAEVGYERAKLGICTFERVARNNSPDALLAASRCMLECTAHQDFWVRRQIDVLTAK